MHAESCENGCNSKIALENEINFRYICEDCFAISIDETTSIEDINAILNVLAKAVNKTFKNLDKSAIGTTLTIPQNLQRKSSYLSQAVLILIILKRK